MLKLLVLWIRIGEMTLGIYRFEASAYLYKIFRTL